MDSVAMQENKQDTCLAARALAPLWPSPSACSASQAGVVHEEKAGSSFTFDISTRNEKLLAVRQKLGFDDFFLFFLFFFPPHTD